MNNTIEVSDGDNDYIIPCEFEQDFMAACDKVDSIVPYSEEWYEACEEFNNKFGQYQR